MINNKLVTSFFACSTIIVFLLHSFFKDIFFSDYKSQFIFFLLPLIWPGVAHGSLDYEVSKKIGLIKENYQRNLFFITYILLAISFSIFWFFFPHISLLIFLIFSVFHFGSSDHIFFLDKKIKFAEIILRGSIPIIIPVIFHKEDVFEIFRLLFIENLFLENIFPIFYYYNFLLVLLFFSILFFLLTENKITIQKKLIFLTEIFFMVFCFILFEPLISFSLYFCFLHSIRHLINEKENLKFSFNKVIAKTLPLTFVTIISLLFIYLFIENYEYKFISILFISLASLTVPHMVLVFLSRKYQ